MTKEEIRSSVLKIRGSLETDFRREASDAISQRLFETPVYQNAGSIYCYVSFRDETGTEQIIIESLRRGKKIAVPRVLGPRQMEFFYIRGMEDVHPGKWGIPEPGSGCARAEKPGRDSLVILPGVAFDRKGNRIGYGGGYYDTYLKRCYGCRTAALVFDAQLVREIPADIHDMVPEMIITEKELILCRQDCQATQ